MRQEAKCVAAEVLMATAVGTSWKLLSWCHPPGYSVNVVGNAGIIDNHRPKVFSNETPAPLCWDATSLQEAMTEPAPAVKKHLKCQEGRVEEKQTQSHFTYWAAFHTNKSKDVKLFMSLALSDRNKTWSQKQRIWVNFNKIMEMVVCTWLQTNNH